MDELDLLIRLRDEVPLAAPRAAVESAVLMSFQAGDLASRPAPARRAGTRRRLTLITAGAMAVAACLAAILVNASPPVNPQVIAWSGRPAAGPQNPGYPSVGRAHTEAQLVDYAVQEAAAGAARPPSPHEWVYIKTEVADSTAGSGGFLFGPPDKRVIGLQWIRVDRREYAGFSGTIPASLPAAAVVRGTISISPGGGGTLGGWKSVSYPYLNSLPTDPAKLAAVILADNNPRMPWYSSQSSVAVFNAIQTLLLGQMQGVWIPPKLAATMYQLLQRLPGVHFDSAADLAGRTGLGFYLVINRWYKQELVINPVTYTFMGAKTVATRAHTSVATDGTRYIQKGQVLGWSALLEEAIVRHVGQLP
jgi:hypothetical protein